MSLESVTKCDGCGREHKGRPSDWVQADVRGGNPPRGSEGFKAIFTLVDACSPGCLLKAVHFALGEKLGGTEWDGQGTRDFWRSKYDYLKSSVELERDELRESVALWRSACEEARRERDAFRILNNPEVLAAREAGRDVAREILRSVGQPMPGEQSVGGATVEITRPREACGVVFDPGTDQEIHTCTLPWHHLGPHEDGNA